VEDNVVTIITVTQHKEKEKWKESSLKWMSHSHQQSVDTHIT